MNNLIISQTGLDCVKGFEGYSGTAYLCPAGVPTIGYGHTSSVTMASVKNMYSITRSEAEKLLREDLGTAEDAVNKLVEVDLTQNQFDALVSFTFNVGAGAFKRSTLLKKLNAGNYDAVPVELMRWTRGGGKVLTGLVKRREKEAEMWKNPGRKIATIQEDMPQAVEEPVKPLAKSRTIWAGAGIEVAAISGLVTEVQDLISKGQLVLGKAQNMGKLGMLAVLSLVAIFGLVTLYARVDDWRKGRR